MVFIGENCSVVGSVLRQVSQWPFCSLCFSCMFADSGGYGRIAARLCCALILLICRRASPDLWVLGWSTSRGFVAPLTDLRLRQLLVCCVWCALSLDMWGVQQIFVDWRVSLVIIETVRWVQPSRVSVCHTGCVTLFSTLIWCLGGRVFVHTPPGACRRFCGCALEDICSAASWASLCSLFLRDVACSSMTQTVLGEFMALLWLQDCAKRLVFREDLARTAAVYVVYADVTGSTWFWQLEGPTPGGRWQFPGRKITPTERKPRGMRPIHRRLGYNM